jgi:hypothetical protein
VGGGVAAIGEDSARGHSDLVLKVFAVVVVGISVSVDTVVPTWHVAESAKVEGSVSAPAQVAMKGVVERKAAFSTKRVVEENEGLGPEVASNGCEIP